MQAVLAAVAQQMLEPRGVLRGGDDQDVLNAGKHQRGQGVVDHGFVVHRQQLLAGDHGERIQASACAAGKDDTFHNSITLLFPPGSCPGHFKKFAQLNTKRSYSRYILF